MQQKVGMIIHDENVNILLTKKDNHDKLSLFVQWKIYNVLLWTVPVIIRQHYVHPLTWLTDLPLLVIIHQSYVVCVWSCCIDYALRSAWLCWIIVPSFVMKSFPQTCFFSMFVVSSIILGLSYILLKNFYFLLKNGHGQSHSWIFKNNVVVHFMAKGMGIAGIVIWNDLNIFIFGFFPPCKYIRVSCWSEGDDFGKVAEVHFF